MRSVRRYCHIILNDDRRAVAVLFRARLAVFQVDVVKCLRAGTSSLLQMFTSMFQYVQARFFFLAAGFVQFMAEAFILMGCVITSPVTKCSADLHGA